LRIEITGSYNLETIYVIQKELSWNKLSDMIGFKIETSFNHISYNFNKIIL